MKRKKTIYILIILAFLFCISIYSIIEATALNKKEFKNIFELNMYSDKQTYKTNEKIKIWATLKYTGNSNEIKIIHSNPYISFTISDGKKFKTEQIFDDLLASTILFKNKVYNFDYVKSGGYSADDPDVAFWAKFYRDKDLYLPKGEYTVKVGTAFNVDKSYHVKEGYLTKELKIKVL